MTHRIWTDKPITVPDSETPHQDEARAWERETYPIGNGRLGCTAFGSPRCERIPFNQESLWVGNEDNTGAYQPFGDIHIDVSHAEFTDYHRELDIERAVQTITYASGGVRYIREYFASYPAQVIVLRFSSDSPGAYSGRVWLENVHGIPTTADGQTLIMRGDTGSLWYWRKLLSEPDRLRGDREYASGRNIDLDFEARVQVMHEGGSCSTVGSSVVLSECDSITLLLAADTSYVADRRQGWRGNHPHAEVARRIDAAAIRTFDELLSEHVADYQGMYSRMTIDLGSTPEQVHESKSSSRLAAYEEQVASGQGGADRDLEALFYQYGRYLMISSSRAGHGALPANLQGIWLFNRHPPWRSDFHTDVNIQMNYWFTSASNLTECFEPFAHWVNSIREVRRDETRKVLGVDRGWLMRSENGIFGGSTWHIQKGDSAWLCQNLWDHYTFTMDEKYLREYAYPVMKEISEFWIDHLHELPDGRLVSPRGRSPEHGPVDVDGVTYDQQLCRDLFSNTIEASEVLGVDEAFRASLTDHRDRLLGPQVGRWGQLQEWLEDIDKPECDHRHMSHLIGVYPGRSIHPTSTPELAEAARVSLTARRDHGQKHPGWSRVWKACLFARLLDGDSAYEQLAETLATRVYGNLWAVHPPFQIDCNFGWPAALNEMLVQSHLGEIQLLPALPGQWTDGRVTGLRVRGGMELDLTWKSGLLVDGTLRDVVNRDRSVRVRYGERQVTLRIRRGDQRMLVPDDFRE